MLQSYAVVQASTPNHQVVWRRCLKVGPEGDFPQFIDFAIGLGLESKDAVLVDKVCETSPPKSILVIL